MSEFGKVLSNEEASKFRPNWSNLTSYMNPKQRAAVASNARASNFNLAQNTNALASTSAQADNSNEPQNISHQILIEPILAGSGTYGNSSVLGSITSTNDAFLIDAKDKSKQAGELTEAGKKMGESTKKAADEAAKTLTSGAQAHVQAGAKANGAITMVSTTGLKIGGNTVDIGSSSVLNFMTPILSNVAKVMQTHALQSINITDNSFNISKHTYNEGDTRQTVVESSQTVASKSSDIFTKDSNLIATNVNNIQGTETNVYADDLLKAVSMGDTFVGASNNTAVQGGDLYITASASSNFQPSGVGADGSPISLKDKVNISKQKGELYLSSNGLGGKGTGGIFVTSNGNVNTSAELGVSTVGETLSSLAKSTMTSSAKIMVSSATQMMAALSSKQAVFGTPSNNITFQNGMTFIGRNPPPIKLINSNQAIKAQIIKVPAIPTSNTNLAELQGCIEGRGAKRKQDNIPKEDMPKNETDLGKLSRVLGDRTKTASRSHPVFAGTGENKPNIDNQGNIQRHSRVADKLPFPATVSGNTEPTKQEKGSNDKSIAGAATNTGASTSCVANIGQTKLGYHIYPRAFEKKNPLSDTNQSAVIVPEISSLLRVLPSSVSGLGEKIGASPELVRGLSENLGDVLNGNTPPFILEMKQGPQLVSQVLNLANYTAAIGYFGGVTDLLYSSDFSIETINTAVPIIRQGGLGVTNILNGDLQALSYFTNRFLPEASPLLDFGQALIQSNGDNIDSILRSTVEGLLSNQLSSTLPKEVQSLLPQILNAISGNMDLSPDAIIASLSSLVGDDTAVQVFSSVKGIIDSFNSGDLFSLLNNGSLEGFLSSVIGSSNSGSIGQILSIARQLYGTIQAFSKLPQLIKLMDQYDLEFIEKVDIVLNCLDLLNKLNGLLDGISGLRGAENLPRLIQLYNSVKDIPLDFIDDEDNRTIIEEIQNLDITLPLDSCYRIPKTSYSDSTITVESLRDGIMIFNLTNPNINIVNGTIPTQGDIIHARVSTFFKARDLTQLEVYKNGPNVFPFYITEYSISINRGVAIIGRAYSSLLLEDSTGLIYEYDIDDFGGRIIPIIEDSYLFL